MDARNLSRRHFLRVVAGAAAGGALAACQPAPVEPVVQTVEVPVQEPVEVTVPVKETVQVEVTAQPGPAEPINLLVWHWWPSGGLFDAIGAMVDALNQENPDIIVEHLAIPGEAENVVIPTAFAGGTPPDVYHSVGFEWLFSFVDAGYVLDLTDMHETQWAGRFLPGLETAYSYQGKLWAVPWLVGSTPFVFYNIGLMEEQGLVPEEALKTLESLSAACDRLLAADVLPIAFGGKDGWPTIHWVSNCVKTVLGSDAATKLFSKQAGHWSDADVVEAVTLFLAMYDKGYLGRDSAIEAYNVASQRFWTGEAVMFGTGGWEVSTMQTTMETNPDMRLDFVEFPVIEGRPGKGSDWLFWSESWAGAKPGYKREAPVEAKLKVLDAFGSEQYQTIAYQVMPDTYAAKGAGGPTDQMDPVIKKKMDLYFNATMLPIPDVSMTMAAGTVLKDELQGMLLHQVTVEEAMAHIDEALAQYDEYQ